MEQIAGLIRDLKEYQTIRDSINKGITPTEVTGLSPIHRAHLIAALAEELHRQPVVICADDAACMWNPPRANTSIGALPCCMR